MLNPKMELITPPFSLLFDSLGKPSEIKLPPGLIPVTLKIKFQVFLPNIYFLLWCNSVFVKNSFFDNFLLARFYNFHFGTKNNVLT